MYGSRIEDARLISFDASGITEIQFCPIKIAEFSHFGSFAPHFLDFFFRNRERYAERVPFVGIQSSCE